MLCCMSKLQLRGAFALAFPLTCVVACGATPQPQEPWIPSLQVYSCGVETGSPPPAKLLLHGGSGIAGHYIVVLYAGVADLHGTAGLLASDHGGVVTGEFASINGFGVGIADADAQGLADDARVCFVEQDATVSGT